MSEYMTHGEFNKLRPKYLLIIEATICRVFSHKWKRLHKYCTKCVICKKQF